MSKEQPLAVVDITMHPHGLQRRVKFLLRDSAANNLAEVSKVAANCLVCNVQNLSRSCHIKTVRRGQGTVNDSQSAKAVAVNPPLIKHGSVPAVGQQTRFFRRPTNLDDPVG